jgi:hypothetical protein
VRRIKGREHCAQQRLESTILVQPLKQTHTASGIWFGDTPRYKASPLVIARLIRIEASRVERVASSISSHIKGHDAVCEEVGTRLGKREVRQMCRRTARPARC